MPARFFLTAAAVALSILATACNCPKCPAPSGEGSEGTPQPSPPPSPSDQPAGSLASDKPYIVCDVSDHASHAEGTNEYEAAHLKLGDQVTIGAGNIVQHVRFPDRELDMIAAADGSLSAMSVYNHPRFPAGAGPDAGITHLVRIHGEPGYTAPTNGPKCDATDKTRPIIRISFCYKDNGKWFCPVEAPPPSHHYGDVHAQQ